MLSWTLPVGGCHQLHLGCDCSPLFLSSQWWLNTIHIGESLHNGATKVSHHLCGYGHPVLWFRLQPFGTKTLSQAYALVRINLCEVGWLSSFFHAFGWRNISGLFGNPFCGLQYSAGLLELFHGQAVSFGNTVWVVFLDKYPWRTRVALNPEVKLLRCVCKGCSYIKA